MDTPGLPFYFYLIYGAFIISLIILVISKTNKIIKHVIKNLIKKFN